MNSTAAKLKNRISTIKWSPLLIVTASLMLSAAIIPAVVAQSPSPERGHHLDRLNLTPEQQAQLDQIKQAEQERISTILTTEQRSQLETARANGEHPGRVFSSLNLTEEQQTQLEEIRSNTREQMDAILTEEQRQQMQQRSSDGRGGCDR